MHAAEQLIEQYENIIKGLEYELDGYKDVHESKDLLVKELDAAWNGDDVAEAPQLCDLVSQIKTERAKQSLKIKTLTNILRAVNSVAWMVPELEKYGWTEMKDEKDVFQRVKEVFET